jgi:hypothetical protein
LKLETLNLHGLNVNEAREKTLKNIDWALRHGVDVLVINHGKGRHSESGVSVLKTEIRKMLKENEELKKQGYRVIFGESEHPIALSYNEGNTLVVAKGLEMEHIGGRVQQERNQRIFSEEAKQNRKAGKRLRRDR